MELKSLEQSGIARISVKKSASGEQARETSSQASRNDDATVTQLRKSSEKNSIFQSRNNLISLVNIASSGVEEASKLVGDLRKVPAEEVDVSALTRQLSDIAQRETPNGVRPLAGDTVTVQSKTAEEIISFPDDLVESFGLSQEKEPSAETIAEVQNRLDEFRSRSEEILRSIRDSISTLEVAAQNSEASFANVREVDSAVLLAENTGITITSEPNLAIESNQGLSDTALRLVE